MTSRRHFPMFAAAVAALTVVAALPAAASAGTPAPHVRGKSPVAAVTTVSNLLDKGGPVLANSKTVAIYWGTWSNAAAFTDLQNGMAALLKGFEGSSYLNTASQYLRGATATTQYVGALYDASSPPSRSPSTTTIANEVAKVLTANAMTADPNALYLVYTSNLPKVNFCAWHDSAKVNGVTTQVAYMPFTATSCFVNGDTFSKNSWLYSTKALADSTAHEFMEAITDPRPGTATAWVDSRGAEIGDKCNYTYSATVTLSPTVAVPNNTWQIQSEWSNAISGCAQVTP